MAYKYNPIEDEFNIVGNIPQLSSDPATAQAEDTWVLASIAGGTGGGKIMGFMGGMPLLTVNSGGSAVYSLSYKTKEGDIKRVTLT